MRTVRHGTHIARRLGRAAGDGRGVAFITTLYVVAAVGFMLFGFIFLSQNEVGFAVLNRNSTEALGLAEAGVQEAINRVNKFGATPGVTAVTPCQGLGQATYANSLAASTPGACGTITYQAPLQNNAAIFPILSIAKYGGTRRAVRIFEQAIYKTGFGNVIFGPQVTFQGNSQPITGDTYSQTSVQFQQYVKSPPPAAGATATNLIGPQVMSATSISVQAGGPGPYAFECAGGSTTEVAPTPCTRAVDGGNTTIPVNWHPMTPIGMTSADFNTVVSQCFTAACNIGGTNTVTIVTAKQNGVNVTYTSAGTYTPAYWTAPATAGTNGLVVLAVSTAPFCVNSTTGSVAAPGAGGTCSAGYTYYGASGTTRFLDWGLAQDDLTRGSALTFFQAPSCTAPCANGGNQNGIRYIPLPPSLNILSSACLQNVNPGINVFDQVNLGDGISCTNPPTQTLSAQSNVTFSGTKSNPEFLVIDNGPPGAGGTQVHITGSLGTGNATCSVNFDNYNWGIIMATGDIDLTANTVFSGFIYTSGNVYSHGNVVVRGGIFSANAPSGSQVNQVDIFGTVNFCTASSTQVTLTPVFYTFKTLSWQDRPLNQP